MHQLVIYQLPPFLNRISTEFTTTSVTDPDSSIILLFIEGCVQKEAYLLVYSIRLRTILL